MGRAVEHKHNFAFSLADDKSNVVEKLISLFEREENIVGKAENAGNQHFLLFPKCFQKPCFRIVKSQDYVVKG